jgi:hypothetical protein
MLFSYIANLVWGQEAAIGCKRMDMVGGFKEHNNILYASNVSIEKSDGAEQKTEERERVGLTLGFSVQGCIEC